MIKAIDAGSILKAHDLKHTRQRIRVLEEISNDKSAVSQPELEKKLGREIDRVTLYRILNAYEEKGIVHRIMDTNGTANYAICSSACTEHNHHDEHVHFNCTNCNKIYCLEINIPRIKIPDGFKAKTVSFTAYGLCDECNKDKKD